MAEDLSALSDEILVSKTREGDEEAERILLERYKPLVLARARASYLCGGDREDLVQEGMLGCYKAVLGFDAERHISFTAFADLCVRRQIYSAVKSAARKKNEPLNNSVSLDMPLKESGPEDTIAAFFCDAEADPENMVLGREGFEEICRTIETSLSRMEKKVLALYMDGLPYQTIADTLGVQLKSVDNAIQRVKKKLEVYR